MIRRPPRSTLDRSSAASDVYKRQAYGGDGGEVCFNQFNENFIIGETQNGGLFRTSNLSLIHISEPTRPY